MKNSFSTLSFILAITFAAAVTSGDAQSEPPSAATDCTSLAYAMVDCMGFLIVGGNETTPQPPCCSALKTLVEVNGGRVCFAITAAANLGVDVDMSRAEALPSLCGVAAPSFTTSHATSPSLPPTPAIEIPAAPAPATSISSSGAPAIFLNLFIICFIWLVNA